MRYPRLQALGLVTVVTRTADLIDLPHSQAVRVLMTSASRGCTDAMIAALPNLGLVVSQGVGQDKIDKPALERRGIVLRSVGEAATDDVADLAMALTQILCRGLVRADAFARGGAWTADRFEMGDSLVGMTMGIGGLSGRIGQAIAARAKVSRMQIAGLNRGSNANFDAQLFDTWADLARASDVLVLALPSTPDLTHVIDADILAALGPKGRLINVARGNLVDTDALITALESKTIAGAALDVLEGEPIVPPRLAALPNVVLTPHIGAQTWGQRARAAEIAESEILAYLGKV